MPRKPEHESVCDRCATEIPLDETNTRESGEWQGAVLCNDCNAEVVLKEGNG